jgi:3-methyladenine DNA glycosylase/8-oxoguanine DNA glycosylase
VSERERTWRPDWPCPVPRVLGGLRRGPGDPTYLTDARRTIWKTFRTPEGPTTLAIRPLDAAGEVRASAWGSGADWVLDGLPTLLGAEDDPSGFTVHHDVLEAPALAYAHWRVPRTRLVVESLVPAVIEQKVTGKEAFRAQRLLVREHGEVAPGPGADLGMRVFPSVATLRQVPSWRWLQYGVDHSRSTTLQRVLQVAPALERVVGVDHAEADRRLRTIPGIGVWTSAEVRARALGDPDAVSFGDYHVAKDIGWALTGTPVDDEQLAVLPEPYVGHRLRVQVMLGMAGLRRPRRGPRMTLPTHVPAATRGRS